MKPRYGRTAVIGILIGAGLLVFQHYFGVTAGRFALGAFMATVILPTLIRPSRD
ncbi:MULTISPECIES: hypothetical protein [unclassified Streptomyces]|uniref:hypothetical protein n=1 Tax=unclassified Streptomyces TaxID=2593676 RepID=UPI00324A81D0